jgi:hypothetical protein
MVRAVAARKFESEADSGGANAPSARPTGGAGARRRARAARTLAAAAAEGFPERELAPQRAVECATGESEDGPK